MAARSIARPASNEAVPSGGLPSNAPRSAMSAKRIVPADIARGDLLPGREHGEPRACLESVDAQTPRPCPDRRSVAGPVILAEAIADQRGGEIEVACRKGVIDGALDGVVRLVPLGGSPVEGGHQLGLADRELSLEEVPQERVVAVRPAVLVHQQGRACKLTQDIGRPCPIRHDIAERRGQSLEDRRAGQERDLGRRSGARAPRTAGSRR